MEKKVISRKLSGSDFSCKKSKQLYPLHPDYPSYVLNPERIRSHDPKRLLFQRPGVDVIDHNFLRFLPIVGEKIAVFLKTNATINLFLQKIAVVCAKNANFFAKFFAENIFKIITSVPGSILTNLNPSKFYCGYRRNKKLKY
jgi:hypothetical protein